MKIVYVTGCLGFIGSYITKKCLDLGWVVYGVDKCTYAANEFLLSEFCSYENFKFIKEDIKDLKELRDCDYVINTAAESHVGNSIINSQEFINTNIIGTKNLLDLIRFKPENVNEKPIFLHFSTDEVYGDIKEGVHTEEDLLKPSNPYSAAKAAADMLVFAWARTYNLNYVIVRPTNNYGMRQYPEKLVPLAIKNLNRGKKIRLHNNGDPIRTWLHADDTAEAIIKIIQSGNKNEIYNISGGFEQTNLSTVKKIIKEYFGTDEDWEKYVDFSYNRLGQDVRYALNDSKIRDLGWKPAKVFDEELPQIVSHYKSKIMW